MEHTLNGSRLRYLDASDVDDSVVNFDGLDVLGREGDKLGDIDGFLVDTGSGRVVHAVVDAGGWFTSQRFLLPIGHATAVDREAGALRCDLSRDALRGYPRYDEEAFRDFTDADREAFDRSTADACCPEGDQPDPATSQSPGAAAEGRRHHQQPAWWRAGYSASRLRPIHATSYGRQAAVAPGSGDLEPAVVRENPGGEGMQNVLSQLDGAADRSARK